MAKIENLQAPEILPPDLELWKKFDDIGKKLSKPLVYKDSEWEQVMIVKGRDRICIYKAQDPDKPMRFGKIADQNLKSKYALIKNRDWSFSLETNTYKHIVAGYQITDNYKKVDLWLNPTKQQLNKIAKRVNEAQSYKQKELYEKYKGMQQYAYNEETQDKLDADIMINNLDDSQLT